jgi:hypothetical protein
MNTNKQHKGIKGAAIYWFYQMAVVLLVYAILCV